eukprot:scaffold157851_cov33-Tisochrysis_lutea.AAC.7
MNADNASLPPAVCAAFGALAGVRRTRGASAPSATPSDGSALASVAMPRDLPLSDIHAPRSGCGGDLLPPT